MSISYKPNQFQRTIFLVIALITAYTQSLHAQDVQYSQFYAAPLYLNPAMTGTTYDGRAAVNYRNQWIGLPVNYQTFLASYDQYLPNKGISYGAMIKQDIVSTGQFQDLTETALDFTGAYLLRVNKNLNFNFGLQLGLNQTSLALQRFLFNDQINSDGVGGPSQENFSTDNIIVPEIALGALMIGKGYWFGLSAHHVNEPSKSFLGGKQYYPAKFSVMGGYVIPLEFHKRYFVGNYGNKTISPVFLFTQQDKASQLSMGAYLTYSPVMFGMWYRGIPVVKQNEKNTMNQDALIFMMGMKYKQYKIGYSFDWTISDLPQDRAISHEISITYQFEFYKNYRKKPKKKAEPLPCPIPWNLM
ncbi:PorP/SprF family type IX secretion system membrane protein [Sediminitomix flava]|uniref:Type IX secretion system PorP/SprF family membrane protein n=1 Tax=Sediminitomix flava TaxID=379075 RepID=A0A315ZA98_SEDFL|nr:PorP/SprF family type IX secretion system membrane protein [Sediminitomix flava]PWJ42461.1 type IX secretion system PorP/SprF family membrane protein [Sediminitomix flava]